MLNVEKLGRREGRLHILQDLSFDWSRGVLAVIGGNGTGKTTLLRVVAGAARPNAGKVLWNGVPTSRAVRRKRRDRLRPAGAQPRPSPSRCASSWACARICAACPGAGTGSPAVAEELGLVKQLDERLANLSGGGRRKAMTAQALLGASELIVLDEPTSEVDYAASRRFWSVFQARGKSSALVIATHDVELALSAAGRDPAAAKGTARAPGAGGVLRDRRALPRHRRRPEAMGALTLARLIALEALRRPRAVLATIMLALSAGFIILPDPGAPYATITFHGAPLVYTPAVMGIIAGEMFVAFSMPLVMLAMSALAPLRTWRAVLGVAAAPSRKLALGLWIAGSAPDCFC